jgi:hypothetical protein
MVLPMHQVSEAKTTNVASVIAFLSNLWGLLAGLTLVFPASAQLLKAIPLKVADPTEAGMGLRIIEPNFVIALATFASLFVLMYIVSRRDDVAAARRSRVRRLAVIYFITSLLMLALFLVVYTTEEGVIIYRRYDELVEGKGVIEFWVVLFYSAFFAAATAAFTLLGLKEFTGDTHTQEAGGSGSQADSAADQGTVVR